MGIYTSACKNCGRLINWFELPNDKKKCIHCHCENNKEELINNKIKPREANIIRREYKDRQLYLSEVEDYVNEIIWDFS